MKYTVSPLKNLCLLITLLANTMACALDSKTIEQQANKSINELYHRLNGKPNTTVSERIDLISNYFKGKNYILGALGEGPKARYDQFPRYRVDGFDCDTYVTTVLSLALAQSLNSFQQCLKHVRYKNAVVSYTNRNHFMSVDWIRNNQNQGILKDITQTIKDESNKPVFKVAKAFINKPNWYSFKTDSTIRLQQDNPTEKKKRLSELKALGQNLKSSWSTLPYLPFSALFAGGKADLYLFSQIPDGAIIEIVRPNWQLKKVIGTNLNISHLGFAFRNNGVLYFRQASSQFNHVVEVPLIDYLNEAQKSPTIKGINIQVVLPTKPLQPDCVVRKAI